MIVGSLLLILVAVALLVLGLAGGSSVLLISSIAASLLAAVALVAGARQAVASRAGTADGTTVAGPTGPPSFGRSPWQPADEFGDPVDDPVIPVQHTYGASGPAPAGSPSYADDVPADRPVADDPTDDPGVQPLPPDDAARVTLLSDEVYVVDGRPRYHLPGCPHLSGRAGEPLPVSEAVGLGFTPCAGCEPATALLGDSRRV